MKFRTPLKEIKQATFFSTYEEVFFVILENAYQNKRRRVKYSYGSELAYLWYLIYVHYHMLRNRLIQL